MSDTKISNLTAETAPASTDLGVIVDDPSGTPVTKKATLANIVTKGHGLSDGLVKVASGTMAVAVPGTDYAAALGADDNYVTDAEKTKLANLSGTNTGDQTLPTRASLGLDTTDSPQFTGINLGHASDTTITRTGAGAIAVEGTAVLLSGGALGTPSSGTLTNCTGLPVAGITASTSTALGVGSINLGHASDTTITRVSAGVVAVEGVNILLIGGALGTPSSGTLTNCTGLPVAGITASTSTALGVGSIELGHASDTTLTRVSAGVVAIEGTNIVKAGAATSSGLTMATSRVLGRTTAATGAIEELSSVDSFVSAASDTTAGKVELATAAETTTGTDTGRAVTPDGLAGSIFGQKSVTVVLNGTTALTTSEKAYFRIPPDLNGMNLVSVAAAVGTGAAGSSSSGTPTFTIKNVTDNQQMLSTSLTVDANEYTSATAATAAVINTTYDDVATDDLIEVAVTTAGTGVTYASVRMTFQLP